MATKPLRVKDDGLAFKEKLHRLMDAAGINKPASLARILELTPQAVNSAIKRQKIPGDWIERIAVLYNVSADWLLFGKGKRKIDNENDLSENFVYIPLVEATLAAGQGSYEVSDEVIEELAFKWTWIKSKGDPKDMALLHIVGHSMEPLIHNRDIVLIDHSKKNIKSGDIYAIGYEDCIYVKRLMMEPGEIIIRSENPEYSDIKINLRIPSEAEQFRIIGKVIWWCHEER